MNQIWINYFVVCWLIEFFGGQCQCVFLVMVLVQNTFVVLFDELIIYFDINYQVDLMWLMGEFWIQGKMVVVVLYDFNQVSWYCD